jgi:hypothetical protein
MDYCGGCMFVVGYTEGGAPYGYVECTELRPSLGDGGTIPSEEDLVGARQALSMKVAISTVKPIMPEKLARVDVPDGSALSDEPVSLPEVERPDFAPCARLADNGFLHRLGGRTRRSRLRPGSCHVVVGGDHVHSFPRSFYGVSSGWSVWVWYHRDRPEGSGWWMLSEGWGLLLGHTRGQRVGHTRGFTGHGQQPESS